VSLPFTGIVRPARLSDLAALTQLATAVATQPLMQRYGVSEAGLLRELRRLAEAQERAEANGDPAASPESLLVAQAPDGGELCGLARFSLRGQFGYGGYLRLIALRPGWEGRGIGSILLRAVEASVLAHSPVLFLLTSDFNTGAQRFYARHGYAHAGALPDFALPGISEQIFWKRLR
jgi:ribosomal protein S18 acetylase RimI-like enzyme